MSGWSPPAPSPALVGTVGLVYLVVLAYAVFIQGSILLGLLFGVVLVAVYLAWRLFVVLESIADSLHRIADQRDAEE
jgi:uncharacterized membrane protein